MGSLAKIYLSMKKSFILLAIFSVFAISCTNENFDEYYDDKIADCPNNEIRYTSTSGYLYEKDFSSVYGWGDDEIELVEHGYENGYGYLRFSDDVTHIPDEAFMQCSSLISLCIPKSVTSIGKMAFWCCGSMQSLIIKGSIQSIGYDAFMNCDFESIHLSDISAWLKLSFPLASEVDNFYLNGQKIKHLVVPDDVTQINDRTFQDCMWLEGITLGDGVKHIGDEAFEGAKNLRIVKLGKGLESVGFQAFNYHYDTDVYVPDLRTWLKIDFADFTSTPLCGTLYLDGKKVEDIVIPDDVTKIKDYTFYSWTWLKSIKLHEGIDSIGESSFDYCGLKSVVVPNSVKYIARDAFVSCYKLETVTLGSGVTNIGRNAFNSCGNLKTVYCKSIVPPVIESGPFDDAISVIYVPKESLEEYKREWARYYVKIKGYDF